jgi:NADH-quinone oxidoreductase subunit H
MFLLDCLLGFLVIIIPLLISVAFLTLLERKVMASMQLRFGPNVVGFFGLLQPLADGFKLLLKESVVPTNSNTFSFIFAPVLTLFLSFLC